MRRLAIWFRQTAASTSTASSRRPRWTRQRVSIVEAMGLSTAAIEAQVTVWPEVSEVALSRRSPEHWHHGSVQPRRGPSASAVDQADGIESARFSVYESQFSVADVRARRPEHDVIIGTVGERPVAGSIPRPNVCDWTNGSRHRRRARDSVAHLAEELDRPSSTLPLGEVADALPQSSLPGTAPTKDRDRMAIHPAIMARVIRPRGRLRRHLRCRVRWPKSEACSRSSRC
jgi:hypothetical protein